MREFAVRRLLADMRPIRSRIADVAGNVCMWDERRAEFDPLLPVGLERSGPSRTSLRGQEQSLGDCEE